jgi:GTPase SAR1 family protein
MQGRLKPTDVFTPNGFPLEEYNVYSAREAAEQNLDRGLGRREVPVVFGEFGVGKTTLVKRFFLEEEREGRFVHFLSPSGKNLDDVARVVLEALDYAVVVTREHTTGASAEAEVGGGIFGTITARFKGRVDKSDKRTEQLVVTTPTDQGLLNVMADARVILAIDEMHKASEGFRLQLAEMIKAASNLGRGYPKVVVLGTTADASDLVRQDEGIDRLIREVRVEPMTDEEARFVVVDGMGKLNIRIDEDVVEAVIRTAAGAPALLQAICLDVAEAVDDDGREEVQRADLENAIRNFLMQSQARLTQRYMTAIETVGPKRYRKQILRAMAESPNDFVTMDELTDAVTHYVGEHTPSTALSGPLRELKQPLHGEILRDVERPAEDGSRVYNLTAFKDPRMKAFIRAMNAVEQQGLLPTTAEVAALELGEETADEEQ